jgi:hypothetical protein
MPLRATLEDENPRSQKRVGVGRGCLRRRRGDPRQRPLLIDWGARKEKTHPPDSDTIPSRLSAGKARLARSMTGVDRPSGHGILTA